MNSPSCLLVSIGLAIVLSASSHGAVLRFDDIPGLDEQGFLTLDEATELAYGPENRGRYGGVLWDYFRLGQGFTANSQHASDWWCSDGIGPFMHAHSGQWALFASWNGAGFSAHQILTGVWFARPTLDIDPGGAIQVTVTAFAGSNALASVTLDLVDTTPVFMDTSSFLFFPGITRYTIDRVVGPGVCQDNGYYIADDFQFASRSLAELCPRDGLRRGHAKYVRCLHRASVALVREGALTRRQAKQLLRHASAKK